MKKTTKNRIRAGVVFALVAANAFLAGMAPPLWAIALHAGATLFLCVAFVRLLETEADLERRRALAKFDRMAREFEIETGKEWDVFERELESLTVTQLLERYYSGQVVELVYEPSPPAEALN